jgi:hypothetical protein
MKHMVDNSGSELWTAPGFLAALDLLQFADKRIWESPEKAWPWNAGISGRQVGLTTSLGAFAASI